MSEKPSKTKPAWTVWVGNIVKILQGVTRATAQKGDRVNVKIPHENGMGTWQQTVTWGVDAFDTEAEVMDYARQRWFREIKSLREQLERREHVMREQLKGCPDCGRALTDRLSADGRGGAMLACLPCAKWYDGSSTW